MEQRQPIVLGDPTAPMVIGTEPPNRRNIMGAPGQVSSGVGTPGVPVPPVPLAGGRPPDMQPPAATPSQMIGDDDGELTELPSHIPNPMTTPPSHPAVEFVSSQPPEVPPPPVEPSAAAVLPPAVDPVAVKFILDIGTFTVTYPVVIRTDSCVVLAYKVPEVGTAVFQPAIMPKLTIVFSGEQLEVASLGLQFKSGGFTYLVLPIRIEKTGTPQETRP